MKKHLPGRKLFRQCRSLLQQNVVSLCTNNKGFGILEVLISSIIILIISAGVFTMLSTSMNMFISSKNIQTSNSLFDLIFSKIQNIDYYCIVECDSSKPGFGRKGNFQDIDLGITKSSFTAVLNDIQNVIKQEKFSYFTIKVKFLRRDVSDINGNGKTNDLIPFTDKNGDLIDDYDANIKWYDKNDDGDYYDTYTSTVTSRQTAEQPDTHIIEVTVELWKSSNKLFDSQSRIITKENLLSGNESKSSESELPLIIYEPAQDSFLYRLDSNSRKNAFNTVIDKPYPDEIRQRQHRADDLALSGETEALAKVLFYFDNTCKDEITLSNNKTFSLVSNSISSVLREGYNCIKAISSKDSFSSPWTERNVILDLNPPVLIYSTPTGTIKTRTPCIKAYIGDFGTKSGCGVSTTTVSGICNEVITLKNGSNVIHHTCVSVGTSSQAVVAIMCSTQPYVSLAPGSYTMTIQFGDKAGYKAVESWNFTIDSLSDGIDDDDNTAPIIDTTSCHWPYVANVSDDQTGINPDLITVTIDGTACQQSEILYTPTGTFGGSIKLVPASSLLPWYHTITVKAGHWATIPSNTIYAQYTWAINIE
jgi:hypothetical protein